MLPSSIHLMMILFGGIWATRPPPAPIKGIAIKTSCNRESFNMKFDMGRPFKGIVFAKEFLEECHTKGMWAVRRSTSTIFIDGFEFMDLVIRNRKSVFHLFSSTHRLRGAIG